MYVLFNTLLLSSTNALFIHCVYTVANVIVGVETDTPDKKSMCTPSKIISTTTTPQVDLRFGERCFHSSLKQFLSEALSCDTFDVQLGACSACART